MIKPRISRIYYPDLGRYFWCVSHMPNTLSKRVRDRWCYAQDMVREMNMHEGTLMPRPKKRNRRDKHCPVCGAAFAARAGKKYCSRTCAIEYYDARGVKLPEGVGGKTRKSMVLRPHAGKSAALLALMIEQKLVTRDNLLDILLRDEE